MPKPIAVLTSDIHYSLPTLELADAAMRQAITKANDLKVPLIVAGDLHDTKANLRGECVNAMLETFSSCEVFCYILRGNHDSLHEKSEKHSLNFLSRALNSDMDGDTVYTPIIAVATPQFINNIAFNRKSTHLIPYHHDPEQLRKYLRTIDPGSLVIMHQGISGSDAGEYAHDKSAISIEDVKDFTVISGHYHARQTIDTGNGNTFSYIGNPYTTTFAEASDPRKGFQILMDDGTLEFVPTNLRKHVVIEIDLNSVYQPARAFNLDDLLWVKVKGTKEQLLSFRKDTLSIKKDYRLDLIPTDSEVQTPQAKNQTQGETLDLIIDNQPNTSDERKSRLKELWRKACQN